MLAFGWYLKPEIWVRSGVSRIKDKRLRTEPWDRQQNFEQLGRGGAPREEDRKPEWGASKDKGRSCEQGGPGPLTVRRRWECRADWNGGKWGRGDKDNTLLREWGCRLGKAAIIMVQLQTSGDDSEGEGWHPGRYQGCLWGSDLHPEVWTCEFPLWAWPSLEATGRYSPTEPCAVCSLPGQYHPGKRANGKLEQGRCWGPIPEMSDVKLHFTGRQRKGLWLLRLGFIEDFIGKS